MDEYIKKDAVLNLFGEVPAYTGYETYPVEVHTLICEIAPLIKDEIRKIPAADVAPVRHARWDENGRCSNCGGHAPFWCMASTYYESPWCQECGAKMDGGEPDA